MGKYATHVQVDSLLKRVEDSFPEDGALIDRIKALLNSLEKRVSILELELEKVKKDKK